jgi:lambda repressor-like predicted transcriptional regulator
MTKQLRTFTNNKPKTLAHPGDFVKARIVASGIRLGDLAREAGRSNSTITAHIQGASRNISTMHLIHDAFQRLAGSRISFDDFWFPLLPAGSGQPRTSNLERRTSPGKDAA